MGIISKISVSFPSFNHKYHYANGRITVKITFDSASFGTDYSDGLKCYIVAEDYYPMCNSLQDATVKYQWPTCRLTMQSASLWLPGKYTLYIRQKDDSLRRQVMTLDEGLRVRLGKMDLCTPMGVEDILTACLDGDGSHWQRLAQQPGAAPLRQRIVEHTRLHIYNELRKSCDGQPLEEWKHQVLCTPHRDLTTEVLDSYRFLLNIDGQLRMIDCGTLFDASCNNPYEHLLEELSELGTCSVCCLTNLGALLGTGGKVIVRRIVEKMMQPHGNALWLMGTQGEIEGVTDCYPSLKAFFPPRSWVRLKPYSAFEMVQAFYRAIVGACMEPSDAAKDALARAVQQGYDNGNLTHWSAADIRRFVSNDVLPRFTQRAVDLFDFGGITLLEPCDMPLEQLSDGHSTLDDSLSELNQMTGLGSIKEAIRTMANQTRFFMERRRLGLKTDNKVPFHAIFTGNPGTGKTTVARQLGKIYHALGLLSRGEVVAVDRTRIVGRYLGETEENMKALFEEARGNVLFIDEAYTLYDGSGDRKDFGCRAIDCLLTQLTLPNPDMLIVFAGYEKEMAVMLQTNPGLTGRFPYKFHFPDYSADELMEIACRLLQRNDYVLSEDARSEMEADIRHTLELRTKNFGNARWVEQFVMSGIIPAMANRVAAATVKCTAALYQRVEVTDVRAAYEQFNPKTIELRPRRQIGFSA